MRCERHGWVMVLDGARSPALGFSAGSWCALHALSAFGVLRVRLPRSLKPLSIAVQRALVVPGSCCRLVPGVLPLPRMPSCLLG